jgi:hypothetical protein
MSKVVNDNYPTPNNRLTDDQIKAKFLEDQQYNTTQPVQTTAKSDVPTEIIDLPSKGYFYPEGHPLSSGKIEMRYMTAKEEDILSSQTLIKQGVVIDKLLQALIVDRFNYNDLLTVDKNAIFIAARILAYGADYEVEINCPSCNDKASHNIDLQAFEEKELDWSKFQKGSGTFEYTLPHAGKNKLTLRLLTHGDEKKIEDELKGYKKIKGPLGVDPELTTRLKNVIVAVDDNTDRAFINKYVDTMLSVNSLALRKYLKEVTPDVNSTFNYICDSCGHEHPKMALPIDVGFFWPGA